MGELRIFSSPKDYIGGKARKKYDGICKKYAPFTWAVEHKHSPLYTLRANPLPLYRPLDLENSRHMMK